MIEWLSRWLGGPSLPMLAQQRVQAWRVLPGVALDQGFERSRYVVVDVETSGLDLVSDRLISIGAVAVENGKIALGDSFYIVLQQQAESDKGNILLHGIGGTEQRTGVPPVEALLAFLEFLGKDPLVAFHVAFDETMIRRAMREHLGLNFKHPWLDLAYVLPELNPALAQRLRALDDWIGNFGIRIEARHNALADALATAQLLLITQIQARKNKTLDYAGLRAMEKAQRWVGNMR